VANNSKTFAGIKRKTPSELSAAAKARISSAEAFAEEQLGLALRNLLLDCKSGAIRRQLGRYPGSTDLVVFFDSYATARFDAKAREQLAVMKSPEEYFQRLESMADSVADEIPDVWRKAVVKAWADANVEVIGDSKSGFFKRGIFMRPQKGQARAKLRLRVKYWEGQAWNKLAGSGDIREALPVQSMLQVAGESGGPGRSVASRPEREQDYRHLKREDLPKSAARAVATDESKPGATAKKYKTVFGRNIDRLRNECVLSFDELAELTKIDKKVILNHVNKGTQPQPRTKRKYAAAFTMALERQVTVAELDADSHLENTTRTPPAV
jgi:hypothetical protein